ncbi:alpha/beta fold hydrolase [Asaia lannensis]|uniref:alpha/beta fold hydrolase n=1 Tax=Asaia lannensis TaxID=415421 RepID=UPI0038733009
MLSELPIVLIHGLNGGGWVWRHVAPVLHAQGHQVITPTLTGTGDRSHLLSHHITLNTHIEDVSSVMCAVSDIEVRADYLPSIVKKISIGGNARI